MLQFKTKVGVRGQIVIPKSIRDNLGITQNKTVILEVEDKVLKLIPSKSEEIAKRWEDIAKKQGCNVSKEIIYGDKLYEDVF